MSTIFMLIVAYILGSLSSAIIVCHFMKLPDPRIEGSKNPGATNVLRLGGKIPALLTLAGDVLKGFIPVLLAVIFGFHGFWLGMVALAACLGHVYPIFFKFHGGKGVATALGVILMLSPLTAILLILIWAIIVAVTRYVSLASIASALSAPILLLFFGKFAYLIPVLLIAALIVWRHWSNIQRLKEKKENKINFKI